ncbi:S1/P1 nuclease, partial [Hansschlegelia quercus]
PVGPECRDRIVVARRLNKQRHCLSDPHSGGCRRLATATDNVCESQPLLPPALPELRLMPLSRSLLLVLALAILGAPDANAWGKVGHQTIGALADRLICPAAKAEVTRLLALEGSKSLQQVAKWADWERNHNPEDSTVHSVRTPLAAEAFDEPRDCGNWDCAVRAIRENSEILRDKRSDDMQRLRALKFVDHLVGDIHQPMHTIGEKKRQVLADGRVMSLHQYWDSGMFVDHKVRDIAAEILPKASQLVESGDNTDVSAWTTESHRVVRDYIYIYMTGPAKNEPFPLSPEVAAKALSIAKERLALAGARLALLLNRDLGCGG